MQGFYRLSHNGKSIGEVRALEEPKVQETQNVVAFFNHWNWYCRSIDVQYIPSRKATHVEGSTIQQSPCQSGFEKKIVVEDTPTPRCGVGIISRLLKYSPRPRASSSTLAHFSRQLSVSWNSALHTGAFYPRTPDFLPFCPHACPCRRICPKLRSRVRL